MKRMKINMIIGKKQIIIGALSLGLCLAVILNWQLTNSSLIANKTADEENFGDATYANNTYENNEYFAQARLTRQTTREEAVQTLANIMADSALSTEEMSIATQKAEEVAKSIEVEGKIETLIKAKGFADCIAFIEDGKADIMVKTTGLMIDEAAQIKDIIISNSNIEPQQITIVEVT